MAKQRIIDTHFWNDSYISELDPSEKYLFFYFLTNPFTSICGVYEIPLKYISMHTGYDKEMILKILSRFERDEKIKYRDGWLAIRNFIKHQSNSPKIRAGINAALKKAPEWAMRYANNTISDLNININHKHEPKSESEPALPAVAVPPSVDSSLIQELFSHIYDLRKAKGTEPLNSAKFFGSKADRALAAAIIERDGLDVAKALYTWADTDPFWGSQLEIRHYTAIKGKYIQKNGGSSKDQELDRYLQEAAQRDAERGTPVEVVPA